MTTHKYVGPKGEKYVQGIATMHRAVCLCKWTGPARVTRQQAAADHRLHAARATETDWDTEGADL